MSDFENTTGLSLPEEPQFAKFKQGLAPYFSTIGQIGVKVLIWGPGLNTHFYPKRDEIKNYLQTQNPNDEVATSEDLLQHIEHPSTLATVQAEMLHAAIADVVFGLVTSDPQQSGIYMEIDNLLKSDSLVNKTWLVIPDLRDWKKVGAFIQQPLLQSFPSFRMTSFRTAVLEKCEQLRTFCSKIVSEERGRKVRHYVQQVIQGKP